MRVKKLNETVNNAEINVEEGFFSKKAVKGEVNKLTNFLTANADKIKSLADCASYILDDISDVTINTAAAKDSEEKNTMIDIADACAKEFGYPNFETLRADDEEVHFEAAKYLSKFVDARRLGQVIKAVKDEIADCERIEEELLEEGFFSKKAVKGEVNKLTNFLTANADKIKSLADCASYILDDISDVTINTAAAKDSEEKNTMIDIADACAKEFGYPNFETLRADDEEVHFEAAKYLSKFVDARRLGQVIKAVKDEIADCERIEEELLKEDLGEDVGEYQEWVDYDMKKYGRISKETFDKLRKADLTVVKDEYGDYEVIPHEKIHEACKKRKVNKKLEESIIYTSEGLNNAMKEFAKVVRDWKKTHVDSQEEKVIAESNWDDDSFNTFIATLEG